MSARRLRLTVRTPHGVVVDEDVESARLRAADGQVGLRPDQEPLALVFEPGLLTWKTASGMRFGATAGGLLEADREHALLLTPYCVAGVSGDAVRSALDHALAEPDSDAAVRKQLGDLEQRILGELRQRAEGSPSRSGHA